jgi:hypothetical protein
MLSLTMDPIVQRICDPAAARWTPFTKVQSRTRQVVEAGTVVQQHTDHTRAPPRLSSFECLERK